MADTVLKSKQPKGLYYRFKPTQFIVAIILLICFMIALFFVASYMSDRRASKVILALLSLPIGVGGIWAIFYLLNRIITALNEKFSAKLLPYVFIGPAFLFLFIYLLYPIVRTTIISLYDRTVQNFIGFENYKTLFTDPETLLVLRNTAMWIIIAPLFSVTLGLLIAVMTDHLKPFWEKMVKSMIFLPMAVSFIGASVIWRFVYYFQPPDYEQIGLLNAVVTSLGGAPQAWLTQLPWRDTIVPWFNNIFLISIMIWLQTGFAMVILSSAVKSVPKQLLEAARVDGAREVRVFFSIIIPYIRNTLLTVTTTILILVLKVFDIVFVMTSGQYDTDVIASRMYIETFKFREFGRGSALSVILLIAVIPFIIRNIQQLRADKK